MDRWACCIHIGWERFSLEIQESCWGGNAASWARYSDKYREMDENEEGSEITTERKREGALKWHDEGNAGRKEGRTGECHSWRRKKHKRYKECEVKRRKRNGWRREECAERVEERREEQERIDETKRQRRDSRVGSSPDPVDTTTITNITVATSTTTRYRTRRATWSPNVYAPDTQWDLFVSFFRPSVPASLSPSPFASRYFFHSSQCAFNDPPFWEMACSHFPSTSS